MQLFMRVRIPGKGYFPCILCLCVLASTLLAQESHHLPAKANPPSQLTKAGTGRDNKPAVPVFKDIALEARRTVTHLSSNEKRYVIESITVGVCLVVRDNDDKLDNGTVNVRALDRY